MKRIAIFGFIIALTGCESLQNTLQNNGVLKVSCQQTDMVIALEDTPCTQLAWINYYHQHAQQSWPQRAELIDSLDDTLLSRLQQALLSFPTDTPYKSRLRAQLNLEQSLSDVPPQLRTFFNQFVLTPNQQLLEFESALVMLSKQNTQQVEEIQHIQQLLTQRENRIEQMHKQIEALLKIESNLSADEVSDGQ